VSKWRSISQKTVTLTCVAAVAAACSTSSGAQPSSSAAGGSPAPSVTGSTSPAAVIPATRTPLSCDVTLTEDQVLSYAVPKANKRYHITLAVVSLAEIYYQNVIQGAKAAAAKAGVDLNIVASQGFATAPQQGTEIQNVLSKGTDAIVLGPADPFGLVPAVDAATAKNVPVIDFGTMINSRDAYQIQQDDYEQGVAAADTLAKQLPNGGQGIVMGGPANATWSNRRTAGFQDEIAKYPGIKVSAVVNTQVDPAEGLTKFINAATANPKVDWIYTVYNFILAPQAVPSQYQKAVYLGGALEPATDKALQDRTANVVIADHPVSMGWIGVSEAVAKLNGTAPPKLVCLPNTVITPDMLGTPIAKLQQSAAGLG
jgi:ribose transport system substrate-binding protein